MAKIKDKESINRNYIKKEPNRSSSGTESTITEMKNLPEGLNSRFEVAELKSKSLKIDQSISVWRTERKKGEEKEWRGSEKCEIPLSTPAFT